MAATLDGVTFASNATVGHSATMAVSLDDVIVAASATLGHTATLAATLETIAVDMSAVVTAAGSVVATIAFTLDGIDFNADATLTPTIIIIDDTHDGDKQKKRFNKEVEDKKRRKKQIIDAYEELVELRPRFVEQVVAPFVKQTSGKDSRFISADIDFDALFADVDRAQLLIGELQELDDEEVLLLL
jgi:hypothetical protein